MDHRKRYNPNKNVLVAAQERIAWAFDEFEKVYVSFSAGKDSTVMLHLVMAEAIRRGRRVGVLIIDLEAQYQATVDNMRDCVELYREHIDLHWVCLPINLRNAVTNFEPQWTCWDPDQKKKWVRPIPPEATTHYDWFVDRMEFEEFMVEWGRWYGEGKRTAAMIGIRADESLHRLGTIVRWEQKPMWKGRRFTTGVVGNLYNVYPIYDWRTEDIWRYHARFPDLPHNTIYDLMHKAGVPLSKQRLCQPYGDDQRQGLWLFHLLEPETWTLIVARVNGANTGALYVTEQGNIAGYGKVTLPKGHTWKSYTNLLLASLPKKNREHFIRRFQSFIKGWQGRGYVEIPDSVPEVLESKQWAPSWRRMAKCLLRNDHWCKTLGQAQPKSEAWMEFKAIRAARKERDTSESAVETVQNVMDLDALDLFEAVA
jgi:predicted phosphoadenosine phosphosulfate sulfurtransferase